ncbi:cytochrome ubiquinol oxidase subunit I [Streptomyces sp. NBC_00162]|uniref:cytochrome ubiquinol oxidase subunit I n=1 Tax=Streptomyces sp. NBC_00162 TaxID=2903629 RepID=UPI00214C4020|nr:cytochrome ubiquinol oxidase subunit I [Streptomyces sp. NBC_00162]UUU44460.1 cytochrome ubiquinol oxidase subunit I [Streptomyces sp. NBC_00162]
MARWQFGITTVYHFLFVPFTISLAAITAGLETAWVRTGKEKYFHATKFWGKLFLINIAMGVVTGIVQEFQFGMNWSDYSRFVGDIFGAPLAFEALVAFFLESTFIGLWIFGWDRLPKKLHCLCIWLVSIGTILSSYFILAANSWMQHPVGYALDKATGRARLTHVWAVLTQHTTLVQAWHTLSASFLTGAAFVVGISAFHLRRAKRNGAGPASGGRTPVAVMRTSLRLGLTLAVTAGLATAVSGDSLGQVMFEQQPMKMAAAEALWDTRAPAPFSVFAVGDVDEGRNDVAVEIPGVLSFFAHHDLTGSVPGVNDTARREAARYGGMPEDYIPDVFMTFWGFRLMIGFGMVSFAGGAAGLWLTRSRRRLDPPLRTGEDEVPRLMLTRRRELGPFLTTWYWRTATLTLGFPLIANSFGWIFTEMGRQPWAVNGLMKTRDAVSPGVSTTSTVISLTTFTLLYAALAVIEVRLLTRYAKAGPQTGEAPPEASGHRPLAFTY